MQIEPLSDAHDRGGFFCGVEPLDRYFRTQVGQDIRRRVATCFVMTDAHVGRPIGFYTLAATSMALADLPTPLAKRLPRYPVVPATLMGRLAVDQSRRGEGLGQMLLLDALGRALRSEIATYAFVVDAKDEVAEDFYTAHGFRPLIEGGRRMLMPMAEVATLFG